jgi:hypothetical protein
MPNFTDIESDEEEARIFLELKSKGRRKQYKKEKSLGVLCQYFIYLFIFWKPVLGLEEAAKKISVSEQAQEVAVAKRAKSRESKEHKLKTKVRRLYDIANVLSALGLIEKSHALNSKKPAFRWLGMASAFRQVELLKQENQVYRSSLKKSCE